MKRMLEIRNQTRYPCISVFGDERLLKKELIKNVPTTVFIPVGSVKIEAFDHQEHCFLDCWFSVPPFGGTTLIVTDTVIILI
ncbi:MAG: hypothetical protein E7397_03820 [Ruminococcaceae bacterium]|nr:hypothetical protein [Oscillospiraceae bacterium]